MTKKEIIKTIEQTEQEQWELLRTLSDTFGADSIETERQRSRWATINILCEKLGIEV